MGEKKNVLKKFLSAHPICCFCGGVEPAEEQDHLPPRSVFDNKKWPEGYIFPACKKCNRGSSKDDTIFALVARIYPVAEESEDVFSETEKLIKAYIENYPDEASNIFLSANQKRGLAKKHNLPLGIGESYGELPVVKVPDSWIKSVDVVSIKLIKALHYKHAKKIIPCDAGIKTRWWTNAQYQSGTFPKELTELMGGHIPLKRDNVNLNSQFSYNYKISEDGRIGMYCIYFRLSFCSVGLVSFDPSLLNKKSSLEEIVL